MYFQKKVDADGKPYLAVSVRDFSLVENSMLNKGMGFTQKERDEFNLHGLVPAAIATLADQTERSYKAFLSKPTDLDKYLYLRDLQDSNETLFYHLLIKNVEEMMPIVYTPTVGLGCQRFSHIYRRPRGLFISYENRHRMDAILSNRRFDEVRVIVVTDGERILGLGDQGAGGMGIPIGKLSLYTALAGVHPASTLPIMLDVGTNNAQLINDPLYIGMKHERIRGKDYDDFIEQFVISVNKRFPHVLLQWEDFAQQNAVRIWEKYRHKICSFNDDIQGTAGIVLGALLSATKFTGIPLPDLKIVVVGAGSAGCGISELILYAMTSAGLSEETARSRFYLVDRYGLLTEATPNLLPFQKKFAQKKESISHWQMNDVSQIDLKRVIEHAKPHVLIGASGQAGIFDEAVVREMAKHHPHPIIFPLSNPTSVSEAVPSDLVQWTEGRVIVGTGSPFPPIMKDGRSFRVDQANNAYIFPGIGLGLISVDAKEVTPGMFIRAANALAEASPLNENLQGNLLPPFTAIRDLSFHVAFAVAKEAVTQGFSDTFSDEEIKKRIKSNMWTPAYLPYVAA